MSLTADQWYQKLQKFVPGWWFDQDDPHTRAIFKGVAAVMTAIQQDSDDQFTQAFVMQSSAPILDLHGDERGVARGTVPPEDAPLYAKRVQRITSATDNPSIQALVNSFLISGSCSIVESPADLYGMNHFTVHIPAQTHAPYSFADRGYYTGRATYTGSDDVAPEIIASIQLAVDAAKAFGVLYTITEP